MYHNLINYLHFDEYLKCFQFTLSTTVHTHLCVNFYAVTFFNDVYIEIVLPHKDSHRDIGLIYVQTSRFLISNDFCVWISPGLAFSIIY